MPTAKYRDPITKQFVPLLGSGISEAQADAKYALQGASYTKAETNALILPIGAVSTYAGMMANVALPWMVCQGQAISRTTYNTLWLVLGSGQYYGVGDGSTTFNIPNLMTRMPAGYDTANDPAFGPLGAKGGAKVHTLSWAEMPAHNHTIGTNNNMYDQGRQSTENLWKASTVNGWVAGPYGDPTGTSGSGAAHNNMPPYIVMHFIIRVI